MGVRVAKYLSVVVISMWAVAAIALDVPFTHWRFVLAALYLLAIVFLLRRRHWLAGIGCFVAVLIWWLSLKPSNEGPWQTDVSHPAYADVQGGMVTIHNFRSCDYRTEFDYTCQWRTRTLQLDQITGLDLFMDYWGLPLIAHTILSFPLSDRSHVAFSIEARRRPGQAYSAYRGFFRQFTLISVVSDERDLVRLRTNYRKDEELYLFHTTAAPPFAQQLFMNYIGMTNQLYSHPAWYNAVTHNCTTEIYTLQSMRSQPWDWRILLNGKGDEMLYQRGSLAADGLPFPILKRRAWINPAAHAANDDPDFSSRIRQNRPGFPR